MLEMFVVREAVFFLTGVIIGIGAIARLITGISLKKLVKAASNMSKSNHPLMRLVRAKFEHGCMVSDKVQNVDAFVEKYLYEYRVLGVRLHTWRQWAKGSIWLCLLFGATGMALAYMAGEKGQGIYRYGILGGAGAAALFLLRMLADDAYQLDAAKTYMVDFLENTYAHRYAKTNQKEIQVTVQRADEVPEKADAEESVRIENVSAGDLKTESAGQQGQAFSAETVPVNAVPNTASDMRTGGNAIRENYIEKPDKMPYSGEQKTEIQEKVKPAEEAERLEPTKEARIREILEEFLA